MPTPGPSRAAGGLIVNGSGDARGPVDGDQGVAGERGAARSSRRWGGSGLQYEYCAATGWLFTAITSLRVSQPRGRMIKPNSGWAELRPKGPASMSFSFH